MPAYAPINVEDSQIPSVVWPDLFGNQDDCGITKTKTLKITGSYILTNDDNGYRLTFTGTGLSGIVIQADVAIEILCETVIISSAAFTITTELGVTFNGVAGPRTFIAAASVNGTTIKKLSAVNWMGIGQITLV